MTRLGFVGLGRMGAAMAPRLLGEGRALAVWNRNAARAAPLVAAGATLARALKVAQEIESLCDAYLKALAVGEPVLLTRAEMAQVQARFATYGQQRKKGPA